MGVNLELAELLNDLLIANSVVFLLSAALHTLPLGTYLVCV